MGSREATCDHKWVFETYWILPGVNSNPSQLYLDKIWLCLGTRLNKLEIKRFVIDFFFNFKEVLPNGKEGIKTHIFAHCLADTIFIHSPNIKDIFKSMHCTLAVVP